MTELSGNAGSPEKTPVFHAGFRSAKPFSKRNRSDRCPMCRSWCASGVVIRIPAGGRLLLPHFAPEVIRSKAGQIFEAAAEMEFIRISQIAADVFNGPVECFEPMPGQVNLEVVHIGFGQGPGVGAKGVAEPFAVKLAELRPLFHCPPVARILPDSIQQSFDRGAAFDLLRRTVFGGKTQKQRLKVKHSVQLFQKIAGIQPRVDRLQNPGCPLRKNPALQVAVGKQKIRQFPEKADVVFFKTRLVMTGAVIMQETGRN